MIEVKNITKTFSHKETEIHALKDVSFELCKGKSLAICGASGAGKSTLLNIIGGLDRPTKGNVLINGCDISQMSEQEESQFRSQHLGFIFQFHHLLNDFNILENTMVPLLIRKVSHKQAQEQAMTVLQKVGLKGLEKRFTQELSGGEQQRAALARAIIHRPALLFADEPTGNLDEQNASKVFDLLCNLNRDLEATLIVVTHSKHYAQKLNHKIILDSGKLIEKT